MTKAAGRNSVLFLQQAYDDNQQGYSAGCYLAFRKVETSSHNRCNIYDTEGSATNLRKEACNVVV